jgi:hypothetical protein
MPEPDGGILVAMDCVQAPFSEDQLASVNAYQACGVLPPFRCISDSCPRRGRARSVLHCEPEGLYCTAPGCGYQQDWAPEFMANWVWKQLTGPARGRRWTRRTMRSAWRQARRALTVSP